MRIRWTCLATIVMTAGLAGLAAPASAQELSTTTIDAPDAVRAAEFGAAVALDGDLLVVGAPDYDLQVDDETIRDAGAAFVYVREDAAWRLDQRIDPPAPLAGQRFGHAVDVSRGRVLIGGPGRAGGLVNAPGLGTVFLEAVQGAAYSFLHDGSTWQFEQRFEPEFEDTSDDSFGFAVAVRGNSVLVGAPSPGGSEGLVFPWERIDGTWVEGGRIYGRLGASRGFGSSISMDGKRAVVGSPDGGSSLGGQGAVSLLYRTDRAFWVDYRTIDGPVHAGARFGAAVALSDRRLVVGAPGRDGADGRPDVGRVHTFDGADGLWVPDAELELPDAVSDARFGGSLSLLGDTLLVASAGGNDARLYRVTDDGWEVVGSIAVPPTADRAVVALDGTSGVIGDSRNERVQTVADTGATSLPFRFATQVFADLTPSTQRNYFIDVAGGAPPTRVEFVAGEFYLDGDLDPVDGLIVGPTRAPGSYTFTVRATDADGAVIEQEFVGRIVVPATNPAFSTRDAFLDRPYADSIVRVSQPSRGRVRILEGEPIPGTERIIAGQDFFAGRPTEAGTFEYVVQFEHDDGRVSERETVAVRVLPVVDLSRNGRSRERVAFGDGDPTEQIRVLELLEGSRLDVRLRGEGAENVALTMTLDDSRDDTTPVDLGQALEVGTDDVRLRRFVVPDTARYLVRLNAQSAVPAELRLEIRARAPRRFSGRAFVSADNEPALFYTAPSGARVVVTVRPERKRTVDVTLGRIFTVRPKELPGGGARSNVRVAEENVGDELVLMQQRAGEGFVRWKVRVRPRRGYRVQFLEHLDQF